MTILEVYKAIIKRLTLIIVITMGFGLISGIISWYLLTDVYQASATILVSSQKNNQKTDAMTYSDYTLNVQLTNSYQILCKTDRVLKEVIKETGLPLNTKTLRNKISVASQKDTEIISISVEDEDPAVAQKITNCLADVFQEATISIMKMDNVQIIDYAEIPETPIKPNRIQNLFLALLLGLAVGIGLAVLIEFFDTTVRTTEKVEEILCVPVLGVIPNIKEGRRNKNEKKKTTR